MYDFQGEITLRLVTGRIYRENAETIRLIWDSTLKRYTIHVIDLIRAILYAINKDLEGVYNLVDDGNIDLGTINNIIESIFETKIEHIGKIKSFFVQLGIEGVLEVLNEKHLNTWIRLCGKYGIQNSPINVNTTKELLLNRK